MNEPKPVDSNRLLTEREKAINQANPLPVLAELLMNENDHNRLLTYAVRFDILIVMPNVGEIKKGRDIGQKRYSLYFWQVCPKCGKERWVVLSRGLPLYTYCHSCANTIKNSGQGNHFWKGGRRFTKDGYVQIRLQPDDFFYSMTARDGYVREHRLIMAKYLKRCLLPWEIVHHKNGNRLDNQITNLTLMKGNFDHQSFTVLQNENRILRQRINELEKQLNRV